MYTAFCKTQRHPLELKNEIATTTARTHFGEFLTPTSNSNTPSGPLFKVTNTVEGSYQTKIVGSITVNGVDVKISNTTNVSTSKVSNTVEVSAGKKVGNAEAAVYVSHKQTSNGSQNSAQTDVGVKANYRYKQGNTSVTVGVKATVTLDNNDNDNDCRMYQPC
jgi:hypothetical protein